MIIQACLNGGRSEHFVPKSPSELSKDAVLTKQAGAACFHIHPRDQFGEETLHPVHVADALNAIRAAVPGIPVGIGSGAWIEPGGRNRHSHISAWEVRPDYVSVNFNEEDAPEVIEILADKNIQYEAGIWTTEDCERFLSLGLYKNCLRILVEMNEEDPEIALSEADKILDMLQASNMEFPILLHGCDTNTWQCLRHAAALGHDTRIGFEDTLTLPDGGEATNAALVAAAVSIFQTAKD